MRSPLVALALLALLAVTACHAPPRRSGSGAVSASAVAGVEADLHPHIARFEAFEVAIQRPGGDVAPAVRAAFREALYRGFLERGYSPLDPDYVDASGAAVARPGLTFPVRSTLTDTMRAADGGVLVSGWVGLVAPAESGGEDVTLYLAEIERLAVPPIRGTAAPDGGAETGRRLAAALLSRLPAR